MVTPRVRKPLKKKITKGKPTKKKARAPRPLAKVEPVAKKVFKGFHFELKVPDPERPHSHILVEVYSGLAERTVEERDYGKGAKVSVEFNPETVVMRIEEGSNETRFTREGLKSLCEQILECLGDTDG